MKLRRSQQMTAVLAEFLSVRGEWSYGYSLSQSTGLKSGTLYPLLIRLSEHGLLETAWTANEDGKPPRHLYRLTHKGLRYAVEETATVRNIALLQIPVGEGAL